MSNRREDIRQAFFNDAQDHLAAMGVLLLELEVSGNDADSELLGGLLRSAHALKCAAGVLELDQAFTLARTLESLLDSWNEGVITPQANTSSRVEKAFDLLAALLTPVEQAPEAVTLYAEKKADAKSLSQIIEGDLGVSPQAGGTFCPSEYRVISPEGQQVFKGHCPDLHLASKPGANLYVIEFLFDKDLEQKDVTPQALLGFLQKSGYILAIGNSGIYAGSLFILYSSFLEIDLIAAVFQLDKARIHSLDLDTLLEGEAVWKASSPEREEYSLLQAVKEPEKDSVDELVRQYDQAMEKLKEAGPDDAGEILEGWDLSEAVSTPSSGEEDDPFHAVLADMAEGTLRAEADNDVFSETTGGMREPAAAQYSVESDSPEEPSDDTDSDDFELDFEGDYLDEEAELLMNELPDEHPLRKAHDRPLQTDDDFFRDSQVEPDLSYLDDGLGDFEEASGISLDLDMPVDDSGGKELADAVVADEEQGGAAEPATTVTPSSGGEVMISGFEVKIDDDQAVVFLNGDVTIERSVQLHEALQELVSRFKTLKINSQGVEAADLTFIQLICAAAENARERGVTLDGDGVPSSAILQMLAMTGFDNLALERRGLSSVFKL
ncbi:STAS domain-containing protein [Oleidesulfovibrio sp.]|uniref:STAS domain-containing protein n=1 Tax=Oleidesulfovibrio sp. TaxID=2909707 RepID=UPI003A856DEB